MIRDRARTVYLTPGFLALVALSAVLLFETSPSILAGAGLIGLLFAAQQRSFPLLFCAALSVMVAGSESGIAIYAGVSSSETTFGLRMGGVVLSSSWAVVARFLSTRDARAASSLNGHESQGPPIPVYVGLLVAGIVGAYFQYRDGIPILEAGIDASRQIARENTSVAIGTLQQGWTIGLILSLGVVLAGSSRRGIDVLMVAIFTLGSGLGGSRNSLLSGIVPPLIVWALLRGGRPGSDGSHRPGRNQVGMTVPVLGAVSLLLLGSTFLASQRIMRGDGQFERSFLDRTQGDLSQELLQTLLLSVSAPIETWARLRAEFGSGITPLGMYSFSFLGSLLGLFGFAPDMNAKAAQVSFPYYMNATTFAGPPLLDGGIFGVLIASVVIGCVAAIASSRINRSVPLASALAGSYVCYITILGLYDFQPYYTVGCAVVALGLHVYGRWEVQFQVPVESDPFVRNLGSRT